MSSLRRVRGFTLIELLIFTGIFASVVVGFITMFIAITRVQSRQVSSSAVQTEGQFVVQQIQYYVQAARLIDMPADSATGTLKLRQALASSSLDPTLITLATGTIYLQQGGGALQALTSNRVSVSGLSFTRHYNLSTSSAYSQDSVSYSFTMQQAGSNATQFYSQTFRSSVTVLAPVPKIALIQQARGENAGAGITSLPATFTDANTTGSLLIAVVSNTGTSTAVVSLSDSAGNSWTKIANPKYTVYNHEITIFDAPSAKNSSNTVTATFTTGVTAPSLFIYEYRGAAASPHDASSTQTISATSTPSSGSANATSAVELVLGALYSNPSGVEIPNPGNGFVTITTSSVSATYVEEANIFITGPVAAAWQYPTQTPSSSAVVVTFK